MSSNRVELKKHVPYVPDVSALQAARGFYAVMRARRSVRMFSDKPVSRDVITSIVQSATSAPSGANKQPWRFVCVQDPALKRAIREGAEAEERAFYEGRASDVWLDDLAPLGTDANKPFLETAPWLVVVLKLTRHDDDAQVYYANESVGIATGFLLAAAHHAGLATLTHTPSPMRFLRDILGRPENEKPYLLIPMGYPADNCEVPVAGSTRRPLEEVCLMLEG
jgi:nitroreductase